ncbi:MAG TPA: AraC family transcriptional regulator [Lysobacter sp.]|nr:AraC family transcriptional regulator [Lysobacter sp.]
MADRLESLLARFSMRAQMFHSGNLCGINDLEPDGDSGQLHLIRQGQVDVSHGGKVALRIATPSLLMYPRPLPHRFLMDNEAGADLTCAHLRFEGGSANPIAATLPPFVCLPLAQVEGLDGVLALLFDEAFEQRCGRAAMLDRLFEVVLIQVLRHLMENGQAEAGMLAGLAHPRLRHAIVAMHEQPAEDWSLESLASRAGMSRSVFASAFRETVGCTPGAYLQRWRVALVQQALRQGRALKLIADDVGYGSEAALSRAFKSQTGLSPRDWRRTQDLQSSQSGSAPPRPLLVD